MIFSEKSETPNLTDYLKAKPDSVVYYGDKKSTASWQLLYFIALKLIAAKHPDELMRLEGKSILGDKIEIGSEIEIREFSHPLGIMRKPDGKWLFAETDFNVQQILLRLKKLMEICKDPLDTMVIYFSANQSQNVSLRTDKSDSPLIRKSLAEIFRPKVPKATPTVTTAEQQYVQWLIQKGEKPSEAQAAFSMTEKVINRLQISAKRLFSVTSAVELKYILSALRRTPQWHYFSSRQQNQIVHTIDLYREFRESSAKALAKYIQYLSVPESTSTKKEPIASKPVATPMQAPAVISPVSQELIRDVEKVVLDADLDGIALSDLYGKIHASDYAIREAVSASSKIVSLAGKLYHEDAFVDWDDGASQMEQLLEKLMERNDGYVSDTQLYEYVRAEMQMFLNDNGISSSAMVYDLARHLFEKVGYHGKHYSFSNKTHISRVGNEQIGSVLDVMRRYAREQGGMFVEENLVQYLQNVGLKTGNLHGQMKLNEEPIFLYYQPDVLITSESLQLNDAWFAKAQQALDKLFSDLGDHIVLRDIQPWWYSLLPALPGDRPWTPLLLQSILGFYSKKLGNAKTICGMASQSKDTLHAMLVSGSSEVQTFSDAVAAWYVDDGITGKRFQAEDLRELLVKRGLLAGSELYGRLHKALANDPRFAWSADNATVTINL